jgi:hypothetical protein
MMARISRLFFVFICVLAITGSFGCEDDVDVDSEGNDRIDTEMEKGKRYLAQALYSDARATFENVLNMDSAYNPGKFGWSISRSLEMITELIDSVLDLATSLGDLAGMSLKEVETPEDLALYLSRVSKTEEFVQLQTSGVIGGLLKTFLDEYKISLETIDGYLDDISTDPGFVFEIESLPVMVASISVMNIGGEYDLSEGLIGSAVTKLFLAIIYSVYATSFDLDILGIVDPVMAIVNGPDNDGVEMDTDNIIGLIAWLFGSNPNLLGLTSSGGDLIVQAGQMYGNAAGRVAESIEFAFTETDDQSNDILAVDLTVDPPQIVVNLDISEGSNLGVTDEDVIRLNITEELRSSMIVLRDNFLNDGAPVSWATHIAPAMAVLIVAALNTGFVQSIIDSMMSGMGDSDMSTTLTGILDSDLISESLISGLLTNIIPDQFQFNFGAYFNNPVGINALLPAIHLVESEETNDIFTSRFLFEWECTTEGLISEDSLLPGLLCASGEGYEMVDSYHFPGSEDLAPASITDFVSGYTANGISEIVADGYESTIPYIPFIDPSMNGLLLVNIAGMDAGDGDAGYSGYALADNYSLNKVLASLAESILGLIGGM